MDDFDEEECFHCYACGREMPAGATEHGVCGQPGCVEMFEATSRLIDVGIQKVLAEKKAATLRVEERDDRS